MIKMLSSTLRKGERNFLEKFAQVECTEIALLSPLSIVVIPATKNASVLPAPLGRGNGQFHVHQGGGG